MTKHFDTAAANWDQKEHRIQRAQMLSQKILSLIELPQASRILDFGCGTGLLGLNFVSHAKELILADTSTGMLEQVEQKIHAQHLSNVQTLNLEQGTLTGEFGLICSLMALHHIEHYRETLAFLAEHLSPQGYLCIIDLAQEDGSFHAPREVPHNGFDSNHLMDVYQQLNIIPIHCSTAFTSHKIAQGVERDYPVFMLIGQKRRADF